MVETPALILTFSPGEKEHLEIVSGFAVNRPANPVARLFLGLQITLAAERSLAAPDGVWLQMTDAAPVFFH